MKACQKWDLLVLNSKSFIDIVMSNLRNFDKFHVLKNSHFLNRKNHRFFHKIGFFSLFQLPHMFRNILTRFSFLRCIYSMYFETCEVVEIMKKANLMGKSMVFFDLENVNFLIHEICRNFLSSTLQCL